jgi:hypothetical protein
MHNLTDDEKKEIYQTFVSANYIWIFVSILVGISSHIIRALRWKLLLNPMGYNPGLKNTFFAVMIGYFANLALPRLGEVTRCGILARYEKIPLQKSFGTVVTERAIDLISLLLAFLVTFSLHLNKFNLFKDSNIFKNVKTQYDQLENPSVIYYIAIAAIVLIAFILYRLRHKISHTRIYQKIREIIFGFFEGLKSLMKIKKPLLFIIHSVLIWVMYLIMTWVVFFSLEETSHLGLDVGLAVLVLGSIGIILVQGGIGIYPWIVAETLVIFAIPETKGYAIGWLSWTGQTLMVILAGLLSMVLLPIVNNTKNGISGAHKSKDHTS